jgi:hypothetical protein
MKIAYLLEKGVPLQASRYKYLELLKQVFEVQLFRNTAAGIKELKAFKPRITIIFGDKYTTYRTCNKHKIPYILVEHDVRTLRKQKAGRLQKLLARERYMVRKAKRIIFTSEDHRDYICKTHGYPKKKTTVLYLRPMKKDIEFDPLPKLPGKTLVYSGGICRWGKRKKKSGYRAYYKYFKAFIKAGWKVYIYTARSDRVPKECLRIGCINGGKVPQGQLYRVLSQYTAGFQSYNKSGTPKKSFEYCMNCRPNKLWEYLAAGIPTIGFHGGRGMKFYNGKWGIVLPDLKEGTIRKMKLPEITEEIRRQQVIDVDAERIKRFILK